MALAAITFKQPHLLIMDEPTNHLDMETIDALCALRLLVALFFLIRLSRGSGVGIQ